MDGELSSYCFGSFWGLLQRVRLTLKGNMQMHMKQYNIIKCMTLDTVHCKNESPKEHAYLTYILHLWREGM
jgi:hypothetical protein